MFEICVIRTWATHLILDKKEQGISKELKRSKRDIDENKDVLETNNEPEDGTQSSNKPKRLKDAVRITLHPMTEEALYRMGMDILEGRKKKKTPVGAYLVGGLAALALYNHAVKNSNKNKYPPPPGYYPPQPSYNYYQHQPYFTSSYPSAYYTSYGRTSNGENQDEPVTPLEFVPIQTSGGTFTVSYTHLTLPTIYSV